METISAPVWKYSLKKCHISENLKSECVCGGGPQLLEWVRLHVCATFFQKRLNSHHMERPDEQDSGFELAAAALVHGGELHSYICVGGSPHKGRSEGEKFSRKIESWDTDIWIYLCNSVLPCSNKTIYYQIAIKLCFFNTIVYRVFLC